METVTTTLLWNPLYSSLKLEMGEDFKSAADALDQIRHYIHFYNTTRKHSSLNYRSPNEYEKVIS